ncbi:phosphocholine cytidylyltransferase family protein [bacterium]|nr:phosphocholine cytidylyltransferase family protein [bacterium]
MQVVLLAAGGATRLRPLTESMPKCLLPLDGDQTILDFTLKNLKWAGLKEIVMVTGFEADQIRKHVSSRHPGLAVTWIHNDRFSSTNNSHSLWMAGRAVQGPFLLLDADILFDRRIIPLLIGLHSEDVLAVRTAGGWSEEDMKVRLDEKGNVLRIGKDIPLGHATGESIGIEKFAGPFGKALFEKLEHRIRTQNGSAEFYEASFQAVIEEGLPLLGLDISPLPCMEIDTPEDYQKARTGFNLKASACPADCGGVSERIPMPFPLQTGDSPAALCRKRQSPVRRRTA